MQSRESFRQLWSAAGRAALRAFLAGLPVYLAGMAAAPNLTESYGLGVIALTSGGAAALRAIQGFIPFLRFPASWGIYGDLAGDFSRTAIASFVVAAIGILDAPSLDNADAALVAAIQGAFAAGFLVLQKGGEKALPAPGG